MSGGGLCHAINQKDVEQADQVEIDGAGPMFVANNGENMKSAALAAHWVRNHREVGVQMSVPRAAGDPVVVIFDAPNRKKPHIAAGQHGKLVRNPFVQPRHGSLSEAQQANQGGTNTI